MHHTIRLLLLLLTLPAAAQQYTVTHLGRSVNGTGSETGAVVIDDSLLLYSSHGTGERDLMQLRIATVGGQGYVKRSRPCTWPANSRRDHSGNAAYDRRNDRLFFTRCEADDEGGYRCAIWVSQRTNGYWKKARRLDGEINRYTCTHPTVAYQADGSTLLYFASNRDGGQGGWDIWYTVLHGEKSGRCVNLSSVVNSEADELTPFYDTVRGRLFFASDRSGGLGGYDLYQASGARDGWHRPQPLPQPVNSIYNDLYFTIGTDCGCWGYFASNREDSFYEHDRNCCNDLYRWELNTPTPDSTTAQPPIEPTVTVAEETKQPLPPTGGNPQPITLYFHNDEPEAGSWSDSTDVTFFQLYNRYMFMRYDYLKRQPNDSARAEINHFFDEVQHNCDRFEQLLGYLHDDLESGRRVTLTLRGYASSPHSSTYNERLSARRIASVYNQIATWHNGVLRRYLSNRQLTVSVQAHGSREASTTADDPIYSSVRARERRVEVVGYDVQP